MVFQYRESMLHTLAVATSDKPRTSFQVVRNNLCRNDMYKISEQVYTLLKSDVTRRDHVVRCHRSQECGSRFVNFLVNFIRDGTVFA